MHRLQKFLVGVVTVAVMAFALLLPPVFSRTVFAQAAPAPVATAAANPNVGVAAAVQSYFADIPIMIAIAKCESGPRQFAADGSPLLGGTGTMVGVFQLDETIHYAKALALGFNIDTLQGNMSYARYLYGAEGTDPWISSFPCWSAALPVSGAASISSTSSSSSAPSSSGVLTMNLTLGSVDPQVLILQQTLNMQGYLVAASGPGSPEHETDMFGALTDIALKKFQCARGIACSGDEATTGYGFLNAPTRAALLIMPSDEGVLPIAMATSTESADASVENTAELAELQSRMAALVIIVDQLEAEVAARIKV